jgi:chromosome segregation ATPase
MVTTDIAQLSRECNAWRETLRSYRDEFGQLKHHLQDLAGHQTNKDVLLEIEHLDNQFHIQLINIHDLKQAIKLHHRRLSNEMAESSTVQNLTDDTTSDHERLYNDYQQLESTLTEVKQEFSQFANHIA